MDVYVYWLVYSVGGTVCGNTVKTTVVYRDSIQYSNRF